MSITDTNKLEIHLSVYLYTTDSPELLPFGVAVGDVRGPTCDDCTAGPVILYVPFTFIETEYRQIYVRICVCIQRACQNIEDYNICQITTMSYSGTCLKRSPLGQISVAALERWLQYAKHRGCGL